jgi:hypothetical protein
VGRVIVFATHIFRLIISFLISLYPLFGEFKTRNQIHETFILLPSTYLFISHVIACILSFIFLSIMCFRRQFLRKM